ncbi:MAG: hypothetical protein HC807_03100, partial [Gammaproteobacteria bacterium]|nr:hypothetical protein [Gammaproteobacteria bacterium]
MFRDHVDGLLPHLERKLQDAVPPLTGALRHVAYLMEKLFKELAAGYSRAVLEVPKTWLSMGYRSQLHTPLVRAMEYHARRLALAQQLYARSPGAVWADVHRLYHLAREWRVDTEVIESPTISALDVYRAALLLAFAQPSKLNRVDFMRVQSFIASHVSLTELISSRTAAARGCHVMARSRTCRARKGSGTAANPGSSAPAVSGRIAEYFPERIARAAWVND